MAEIEAEDFQPAVWDIIGWINQSLADVQSRGIARPPSKCPCWLVCHHEFEIDKENGLTYSEIVDHYRLPEVSILCNYIHIGSAVLAGIQDFDNGL